MQNSSISFSTVEATIWAQWSLATINLSPRVSTLGTLGLKLSLYMAWVREIGRVKLLRYRGHFPALQLNLAYSDSKSLIKLRSAVSSFPSFLQIYSHQYLSSPQVLWAEEMRDLFCKTHHLPFSHQACPPRGHHLLCEIRFVCHADLAPWCWVWYCRFYLLPEILWPLASMTSPSLGSVHVSWPAASCLLLWCFFLQPLRVSQRSILLTCSLLLCISTFS